MSASPAKRTSQSIDPGSDDERVQLAKRVKRERVAHEREVRARSEYYDQGNDDSDGEHRDPSDDDMDDDCDDIDANIEAMKKQRQEERKRRNPDDLATAGVVKEISLVNFMCHENLTVTLAEKINFVVGHNGSGKSAILTGLAVALGAKATTTGRGAGLKSMIMSGKDKAKVTVTMRNVGEDAWRHDDFGDEIVIERTIDRTGASGYKFRGRKDGPIISDKRDTVNKMCNHWQINIDSPLCMLTQDNAKTFLARTDPKVMYSFFLRGTGLASIMEEYQVTKISREKMSRDLANAAEALPEQQAKVRKLQNQIQLAEKARTLRKKQEDLKAQLAWAFVHDKEEELDALRKYGDDLKKKEAKIEDTLAKLESDQTQAQTDIAGVKEDITQFVEGHKQTQQEISAKKRKKVEAQAALAAAQSSIDQCRGEIQAREEEIAEMQEKLAAARREEEGEVNPEQAKLQKQLTQAEAQLSGLQRQLPQAERAVANAKAAHDEAEKELKEAEAETNEAEGKFNELKRNLDNLQARRTDRLAPYGRNLQSVMRAIDSAQWKVSRPIGPLGLHIKLKDDTYRRCISNLLGGSLCAFAVRDVADQNQLLRIFEQCARDHQFTASPVRPGPPNMPTVIRWSGDMFDFSRGDLHRQGVGETVLSKLEIDNDDVLRILVNQYKIESHLVARDDDDALNVINRVVSAQYPRVFVATAREFQHTGQFSNGLRTSGPQTRWRGPEMFVTDVASEIETLRPLLAERERDLRNKRAEQSSRRQELTKARQALDDAEKALKRNQSGIPHVRRTIDSLNDKLRAFRPIDGNATEISLEEVRAEKNKLQEELSSLEGSHEIKENDFADASEEYDRANDQLHTFHEELGRKKDAMMGLQQQVAEWKNQQRHWNGSLERTRREMTDAQERFDKAEYTLKGWTQSALGFMPRPDEFGDAIELETQRKAIDRQIEEARRITNIDLDQVVQQHLAESERLNKASQAIDQFREIETQLKAAFEDRTNKWQVLRRTTSLRIHMRFIENIRKRGFDGRLEFDHDIGEELKLEVATGNDVATQRELVYKTPASLSGGERSFVTVSLLLSMWDSAPANLRCLDEWDVFLDSANRRIAAGLLVEGSKDTTSKQFVLISPLDMNGVNTSGRGNKVIRLADPVRNQRRLEEFQ